MLISNVECLGLYIEVDELLFNCVNGRRILSPILQLCVHKLVAIVVVKNGAAIVKLRRYSHELFDIACYTKSAHQSNTTQRIQGP